jgi:spore maturation protein CgeB
VFYDLDTPVTLSQLARGEHVDYLPDEGLGDFDLVLSFTGGEALTALRDALGARRVAPLFGSVDPEVHHPVHVDRDQQCDLSYLGTYAADRQPALEELFIAPARVRSDLKFVVAGSQYPADFPWTSNMFYVRHMPASGHPVFYCSSGLTLNVTRQPMAAMGHCPSTRLFEAAACGTPILSDWWEGLDTFFEPGEEILIARNRAEVGGILNLPADERQRIGQRARERTLACHTADIRARELEAVLSGAAS